MKSPMPKIPSIPVTLLRILGVLVVAALLVGAVIQIRPARNAQAAATCTSIASGDWSTPANWDCAAIPGAGDNVIISGKDITVSAAQSANNVTVQNQGTLTVASDISTPPVAKLTISGNLDVALNAGLFTITYDDPSNPPNKAGAVEFGPDGNQTLVTHGASLTFWNLTKTGSGTLSVNPCKDDLSLCDGGFEVVNSLTLLGVDPSFVLLRSAVDGVKWTMLADTAPDINWVDVKDSSNTGAIIAVTNGIDSGDNNGWKFLGLSSSPNPSTVEQDVTITMTLPDGAPSDPLLFMDGILKVPCLNSEGVVVNPVPVLDGVATCETAELTAGKHTITVAYTGGTASLDQIVNQSVNLGLHSNAQPSAKDAAVTFTANVMPATASGTVTFQDGDTPIVGCTGLAINPSTGVATCTTHLGVVGDHSISAQFVGPDIESTALIIQSVKYVTTVGVGSSNLHIDRYQKVTLTATITSPAAGGKVTFMENGNMIAGCINVAVSGNHATCDVSSLKPGNHAITVFYSGDATNFSSSSPAIVQKINAVLFLPEMSNGK